MQVWNEPDLTSYFGSDPSANSFFTGTAKDYNDMYMASNNGLRVRITAHVPVGYAHYPCPFRAAWDCPARTTDIPACGQACMWCQHFIPFTPWQPDL